MRVFMTTAGAAALKNAVDTATPLTIDRFRLGEDEDYTPDPGNSQPMPYSVYEGGAADMRYWKMANNDIAIVCLTPGAVNLPIVGNIMLYAGDVAICAGIFIKPYRKWNASGSIRTPNFLSVVFGFKTPADKNLAAGLNLTGLTDGYASALNVATEQSIVVAPRSRHSINRVQAHTISGNPAFAIKGAAPSPDVWYGVPLNTIADVSAGVLSGGVYGDDYS